MRHDDPPARRAGSSREDRLADAWPSGPGSRRTGRRRDSPGTGRGRRRGTAPRRGPRPRSTSWRSRPARRARPGRSQSVVITCRSPGRANETARDDDVRARPSRPGAVAARSAAPMPGRAARASARASARSGCRSTIVERHAGQHVPSTSRWLWPWTPAPMIARAAAGPRPPAPNRRIATPDTAAVRCAVIGPPSRIAAARRSPGRSGSTTAWIGGRPGGAVLREPGHPLDARAGRRRSSRPDRAGRRAAGIA